MARRRIVLVFLLLLLIMDCGGGKPSSTDSHKSGGTVVATDFSPPDPTSTTSIRIKATVLSEKNPEYRWMVNGIRQDVSIPKLSPEHFSKGDTVFCSLLIAGEEKRRIGPIVIGNSKPILKSLKIIPETPKRGTDLSVEADVFDPDGDEIELLTEWFINDEKKGSGKTLSGSKIKAGDEVYAEVVPFDGTDRSREGTTDRVIVQNTLPEILSSLPPIEGRKLDCIISTRDVDGDKVSLSLTSAPTGMRLEGNRLLWEAPEVEKDTTYCVEIIARDGRGGETKASFDLRLGKKKEE